jgi:hypothetical protein
VRGRWPPNERPLTEDRLQIHRWGRGTNSSGVAETVAPRATPDALRQTHQARLEPLAADSRPPKHGLGQVECV